MKHDSGMRMAVSGWQPPADIHYAGSQWLIKLELAGVAPEDLRVHVRANELTVEGARRDLMQRGFVCHRLEIRYSAFSRSFALPAPIDSASVASEYRDGILRIWLNTL